VAISGSWFVAVIKIPKPLWNGDKGVLHAVRTRAHWEGNRARATIASSPVQIVRYNFYGIKTHSTDGRGMATTGSFYYSHIKRSRNRECCKPPLTAFKTTITMRQDRLHANCRISNSKILLLIPDQIKQI
jgi:hypothetical protein